VLLGHFDKDAAVVPVEAICNGPLEAYEQIDIFVSIEIGPAIGLRSCEGKELWLHQLEFGEEVVRPWWSCRS
jgi:hypothetical protein